MPFLIGPMQMQMKSEKHLTEAAEMLTYVPEVVSLPLTTGAQEGKLLVEVGEHVKRGQLIALKDDRFYVPFFSPVSGVVTAVVKKMSARLKPCDHVLISNDFKDETEYLTKTIDDNSSREEIIDFMKNIGLLGQGGAGFPTYIKYSTDKCETLIINAVECEPYLTADCANIERNLADFKQGVRLMFKASLAKACKIGIKAYHTELIAELKELFKDEPQIAICPVKDVYPMGWERTLVLTLLNRHYERLPIEAGAIVSNASTAITLAAVAREKIAQYERIVTVSGNNVAEPHNILCRLGSEVGELLKLCGGVKESPANLLMGGPMMGTCVTKEEVCINAICNGVTVYKDEPLATIGCLRCGRCVEHCPSSLQPVLIKEAAKVNDIERLGKLQLLDCVECGMCSYVCPSKIDVTEEVRRAKRLYMLKRK